jgi:hypothetical protein
MKDCRNSLALIYQRIWNTIIVIIRIGIVADAVAIRIVAFAWIQRKRIICNAVIIIITVAGISAAVAVRVLFICIADRRSVVLSVKDTVSINVHIFHKNVVDYGHDSGKLISCQRRRRNIWRNADNSTLRCSEISISRGKIIQIKITVIIPAPSPVEMEII